MGEPDTPGPGKSPSSGDRPATPVPRMAGSVTLDPLIGRVLLERYEVLRRIGTGGMGAVYVGRQLAVGRDVALKVLRPDLMSDELVRERFRREAEIVGNLGHPNTVQLIDYGETDDGLAVMVMELLRGQSLSERLMAHGPLNLDQTLVLGEEVAGSLAEAHTRGLVHRDLKPANIFLAEVGSTVHGKVLDFGIARLLNDEATRLTSTGQVFGTPRYMSPEQALSTGDVDARSDLYALALILYECLVGRPPFVAQTSIQYLSAHTTQAPPKLREEAPDAPERLEALIDACLAKDPDERPSSAEEVGVVLRAIRTTLEGGLAVPTAVRRPGSGGAPTVDGFAPTHRPSALPVAPAPPSRRTRAAAGVVAAAAVAALAVFAYVQRERPAPLASGIAVTPIGPRGPDAGATPAPPLSDPADEAPLPPHPAEGSPAEGSPSDGSPSDGSPGDDRRPEPPPDVAPPPPDSAGEPAPSPPKKRPPPRRRRPRSAGDLVGPVTEGPRRLVIPETGEEETDVTAIAATCQTSVFAGLSRITTRGCPQDCAVIIDDQCAGRTPAAGRAVPPGRREVSVVCGGTLKRRRTIRFREDQTRVFRCP